MISGYIKTKQKTKEKSKIKINKNKIENRKELWHILTSCQLCSDTQNYLPQVATN